MKRMLSFVIAFAFLVCFSSCDDGATVVEKEKIIAVKYGSVNESACDEFFTEGYSKVTYNSSSDVVLAVENRKVDCGIVDEFELNSFIRAERNIKQTECCEYSIDYCAYFKSDNNNLQKSFNKAIKELKANGKLNKITDSHLDGKNFSGYARDNDKGSLTMLCDPNFKNRVFTDDEGNVIGLDVDIARAICDYLGYDLEIETADFDELFTKLDSGEGDFIISACEVNDEREEYYLASDTYFTLNFYLIERK